MVKTLIRHGGVSTKITIINLLNCPAVFLKPLSLLIRRGYVHHFILVFDKNIV